MHLLRVSFLVSSMSLVLGIYAVEKPGEKITEELIVKVLKTGVPGTAMMAYPKLSETEHKDVAKYIVTSFVKKK